MPLTNLEVETLTAVRSAARKISNDVIDWEERRYELVKSILPAVITSYHKDWTDDQITHQSIVLADEVIKQLRKTAE